MEDLLAREKRTEVKVLITMTLSSGYCMYDNEPKKNCETTQRDVLEYPIIFAVNINGLTMDNKIIGFMLVRSSKWIVLN
jgi:hypothetical protein